MRHHPPQSRINGLLDWYLTRDGVQVYPRTDGRDAWVLHIITCSTCGHEWLCVAPEGTAGIECPQCHACDLHFMWA
ncbi:MAG: hypothetical protein Kow0077_32270 [Anaerolineae bacterium]